MSTLGKNEIVLLEMHPEILVMNNQIQLDNCIEHENIIQK